MAWRLLSPIAKLVAAISIVIVIIVIIRIRIRIIPIILDVVIPPTIKAVNLSICIRRSVPNSPDQAS